MGVSRLLDGGTGGGEKFSYLWELADTTRVVSGQ